MKETSDLIDFWIRYWDHRFGTFKEKEHRKLLFDRSFLNVCRATIYRIEEKHLPNLATPIQRSNKDWIGGFLKLLESAFDRNTPVIADFALDYPVEMKELRGELKAGSFNLAAIYPLLKTIGEGMSAKTIGRQIAIQLQADENADVGVIKRMSTQFVRSQLGKRNHGELKDMPSKIVSEVGARLFLKGAAGDLSTAAEMTAKIWSEYSRILSENAGKKEVVDPIVFPARSPHSPTNHFFRRISRRLQPELAKTMYTVLQSLLRKRVATDGFIDSLEQESAIHDTVGAKILQAYIE